MVGLEYIELYHEARSESLVLLPLDFELGPYDVRTFDIPTPEPRAVERSRYNRDGVRDATKLHGQTTLTMDVHVFDHEGESAHVWLKRLKYFVHPSIRPIVRFKYIGEPLSRATLRGTNLSAPITTGRPSYIEASLGWSIPDGLVYYDQASEATIMPGGGDDLGRTYDLEYDREYLGEGTIGSTVVTNEGQAPTWPVYRIFGPCVNPQIVNDANGSTLYFNITIDSTEYLEVNTINGTARINGNPGANRYHTLNPALSEIRPLIPGQNLIRFTASSYSGNAQLRVHWRSAIF